MLQPQGRRVVEHEVCAWSTAGPLLRRRSTMHVHGAVVVVLVWFIGLMQPFLRTGQA